MVDQSIHIAFSLSDPSGAYSQHLGVALTSVCENTQSLLTIHLLHDNSVSAENAARIQAIADTYGHRLLWHNFQPYLAVLQNTEQSSVAFLTQGAYGRLFLPELVDEPRLLYFDCDVVVDLDILDLWNIDLQGQPLGAVRATLDAFRLIAETEPNFNPWCASTYAINKEFGVLETYFNSGVLLMDTEQIRDQGLFTQVIQTLCMYQNLPSLDETALNIVFKGNYKALPFKFNFPVSGGFIGATEYTQAIWHFLSRPKPWNGPCTKQERYIHYLRRTPWSEQAQLIPCCTVQPDWMAQLTQQHQSIYDALNNKIDMLSAIIQGKLPD